MFSYQHLVITQTFENILLINISYAKKEIAKIIFLLPFFVAISISKVKVQKVIIKRNDPLSRDKHRKNGL